MHDKDLLIDAAIRLVFILVAVALMVAFNLAN